ncbi:MAG: hypothetical protein ACOVP5_07920, partial [Chitinophagales bacterium]
MKRHLFYFTIACLSILNACNNTRITSSWREPDKQVTINNLKKVLVVAMFKTVSENRIAEDQMAAYLKGRGVVSYNYFSDQFNKNNEAAIRDKIKGDSFDGAITMRLIDVDKERDYTPGRNQTYPVAYQDFGGYYYRSWNTYSTQGYYTRTKIFTVEVNVFSIKDNKIIWTGIT